MVKRISAFLRRQSKENHFERLKAKYLNKTNVHNVVKTIAISCPIRTGKAKY